MDVLMYTKQMQKHIKLCYFTLIHAFVNALIKGTRAIFKTPITRTAQGQISQTRTSAGSFKYISLNTNRLNIH